VEDEIERRSLAVAGGDRPSDLTQNGGTQGDSAGLVVAVDVSEGCREEVAAALAAAERVDDRQRLLGGGVETSVRAVAVDAVLLAADSADLVTWTRASRSACRAPT
jgi:hypothetical protein